jgi:hypothetical protein
MRSGERSHPGNTLNADLVCWWTYGLAFNDKSRGGGKKSGGCGKKPHVEQVWWITIVKEINKCVRKNC